MRKLRLLAFIPLAFAAAALANVARPAPNFSWDAPARANSLRAVKGQPIVLLIAPSARNHAFRAQVKKLHELYQKFASRKVIFVAALADGSTNIRSDIPFAIARDPAQIASDYGTNGKFNIVIIGRDGNLDSQTDRVIPASRVNDVIENSFVPQNERRPER